MPDELKRAEELLEALAARVQAGRDVTQAATPRDVATALATTREQWFAKEAARQAAAKTQEASAANETQDLSSVQDQMDFSKSKGEQDPSRSDSSKKSTAQGQSKTEDHEQDHGHEH